MSVYDEFNKKTDEAIGIFADAVTRLAGNALDYDVTKMAFVEMAPKQGGMMSPPPGGPPPGPPQGGPPPEAMPPGPPPPPGGPQGGPPPMDPAAGGPPPGPPGIPPEMESMLAQIGEGISTMANKLQEQQASIDQLATRQMKNEELIGQINQLIKGPQQLA